MKSIAIIGKGGAGKTTIALNLASSLHKLGKEVVIIDANLKSPGLSLFLGLGPITLNDVLKGDRNINEAVYVHETGLKIIPSSISLNNSDANIEKLKEVMKELKFDFAIIDASNISYDAQEIVKAVDEVIVVANPDHVSVVDALRSIKFAEGNNATVIGVLLNNKGYYDMPIKNIEEILEKPVIANIPGNVYFKKSLKMKVPFVNLFPKSNITRSFDELAKVIMQ